MVDRPPNTDMLIDHHKALEAAKPKGPQHGIPKAGLADPKKQEEQKKAIKQS